MPTTTVGYPRTRWTYANDVWRAWCVHNEMDQSEFSFVLSAIIESSLRHAAEQIRLQSINSIVRAP